MAPTCLGKVITLCQFPVNRNFSPTDPMPACSKAKGCLLFVITWLPLSQSLKASGLLHLEVRNYMGMDASSLLRVSTLQPPTGRSTTTAPPCFSSEKQPHPHPQALSSSNPKGAVRSKLILFSGRKESFISHILYFMRESYRASKSVWGLWPHITDTWTL